MARVVVIAALVLCSAGCTTFVDAMQQQKPRLITIEQKALSSAITLCTRFGYEPKTPDFILCAEKRYDQYLSENR